MLAHPNIEYKHVNLSKPSDIPDSCLSVTTADAQTTRWSRIRNSPVSKAWMLNQELSCPEGVNVEGVSHVMSEDLTRE